MRISNPDIKRVQSDIIPDASGSYDLGSPEFPWDNVYAGNISGSSGDGSSSSISVTQSSHGFSVGNILRIDSSGDYVKAQADTYDNSQVVGIVSEVTDDSNFTLLMVGKIEGLSGLTVGTLYYLSSTVAGALTTSLSPKPVLVADTTTSGIFINTRNYGTIVLDRLTADPVSPAVGQLWLRVDL